MKKLLTLCLTISALLVLAACGQTSPDATSNTANKTSAAISKMPDIKGFTYYGDIPENPKKVINFAYSYTGHLLQLGVDVSSYSLELEKDSPAFGKQLKDAVQLTTADTEAIAAEAPDLIIVFSLDENIDKLKKIAPLLVIEYGASDYLEILSQLGQVFGKEEQAKQWLTAWEDKTAQARETLSNISTSTTFTVMDFFDKDIYLYGRHFGRGGELIYQALGYAAPDKVKADVFKDGWFGVSQEALSDYIGDYAVVNVNSKTKSAAASLKESDVWKNIPAVQKGQVLEVDYNLFYFADPLSLDMQLEAFVETVQKAHK